MDLSGTVTIPAVGPVNKKVLFGIGGGALLYVGYAYYKNMAGDAAVDDGSVTDPGYEDPGTIPGVSGAIQDDNGYGSGGSSETSPDSYGFNGTTNAQWTQYAVAQLSQQEKWSLSDIYTALGNYLAGKPLTTLQQSIVQAAIAVAGNPPVGYPVVVPGGNTDITIAPTGLKADGKTSTTVHLNWSPVSGAAGYNVYRSDTGNTVVGAGSSSAATIAGLRANTSYSFRVAARSSSGKVGPTSSSVSVRTNPVDLAAPTGVKATTINRTEIFVKCNPVKGAEYYRWYVNDVPHGASDAPNLPYRLGSLRPNTTYKIKVVGDTTNQTPGKVSAVLTVKTKK